MAINDKNQENERLVDYLRDEQDRLKEADTKLIKDKEYLDHILDKDEQTSLGITKQLREQRQYKFSLDNEIQNLKESVSKIDSAISKC